MSSEPESSERPRPPVPEPTQRRALADLIRELEALRAEMLRFETLGLRRSPRIHAAYAQSARNLLHYLALRSRDVRPLQQALRDLGLSSLGRAESHALCTLEAVLRVLRRLAGRGRVALAEAGRVPGFDDGRRLLEAHAERLLGPVRPDRRVRILVTLPSAAADDQALVRTLLERGMDCARINCAHDDAHAWQRMLDNLRHAQRATGRSCRVLMDLAGPKLRTGPLVPGPAVLKVQPERDALGRVTRAARVWLTAGAAPIAAPEPCDAVLPVDGAWLARLGQSRRVELEDARGARRQLELAGRVPGGVWAEMLRTTYFVPGLALHAALGAVGRVGVLAPAPGALLLRPGDRLVLTRTLEPGREAERDARGAVLAPARVGCTLPEVFEHVRAGESVWFDDGRIGGKVRAVTRAALEIEILHARPEGEKLRADKGINLPDSAVRSCALTAKDVQDLSFVAAHADAVALSFVQEPADVEELQARLRALGKPDLGIVLKIETRRAFEHLAELLLAAMQSSCAGVMIARGDLAVECGFERLAEVQEEILWLCEAAHVPVIWATQVLETLAKTGRPSRAEITDAAMGERAECVMLNKGPHIAAAVAALDDILRRMEGHQDKKSARLRPLRLAHRHGLGPRAEAPGP